MFFNNLRCLVDYGLLDTNSITSVFLCVVTNGNIKDTKTISTFATFGLFFSLYVTKLLIYSLRPFPFPLN